MQSVDDGAGPGVDIGPEEGEEEMSDDNIIDISNRLPPIEVRKSWRQKLPSYYVGKIDALKDSYKSVYNSSRSCRRSAGIFPIMMFPVFLASGMRSMRPSPSMTRLSC